MDTMEHQQNKATKLFLRETYNEKTKVLAELRYVYSAAYPFLPEALTILEQLKDQTKNRKRLWGYLGGTAVGCIGGGMAVAGIALMPFTFGGSVGLVAAGSAVGLAATGFNVAIGINQYTRDKAKREKIIHILQEFINIQGHIMKTLAARYATFSSDGIVDGSAQKYSTEANVFKSAEEIRVNPIDGEEATFMQQLQVAVDFVTRVSKELEKILDKEGITSLPEDFEHVDLVKEHEKVTEVRTRPLKVLLNEIYSSKAVDTVTGEDGKLQDCTLLGLLTKYLTSDEVRQKSSTILKLPCGVTINNNGEISFDANLKERQEPARIRGEVCHAGDKLVKIARAVSLAKYVLVALGSSRGDIDFLGELKCDIEKDIDDFSDAFQDLIEEMQEINSLTQKKEKRSENLA